MFISDITLRNFRNFKNSTFSFTRGVNSIIGENGSGKSNILYAMRLLLDGNLPQAASILIEDDFNRSLGDWRGHWIIIHMTFKDISKNELGSFMAHNISSVISKEDKGTYTFYFRPNSKIRNLLYELSEDPDKNSIKLDNLKNKITIDDYEPLFTYRGEADFSDDTVYKSIIGDFNNIQFPNPKDDNKRLLGEHASYNITSIRKEMVCTYIKALRNVVNDLKGRKSPLLTLLRGEAKELELSEINEMKTKIQELNHLISTMDEITDLSTKVSKTLENTVGFTYAPSVEIKSEFPDDINKIMQSLTLWIGDGYKNKFDGRIEDLSLGGANLIYMTLKLLEYELRQPREEKIAHFLLIEEPEAHVHNHIQKILFDNYYFENTQVFVTTHSTQISSVSRISSMNILLKEDLKTIVCKPSKNLKDDECRKIERYLDATRSNLLFAKGVILVEGDAELILIPTIFKKVFGLSLDEIGISIINMSSAFFQHVAKLFDNDRIQRKCAIITDLDLSIKKLPNDSNSDTDIQKKYRSSQNKGANRKVILDEFCSGNKWINPFYAKHTFEIDTFKDNLSLIKESLKEVYTLPKKIADYQEKLESTNQEEVYESILQIAKKEGKGWYALMLAEKVEFDFIFPQYILEAVSFASSHIDQRHKQKMMYYRLEKKLSHQELLDLNNELHSNNEPYTKLYELYSTYYSDPNDSYNRFKELLDNE
ncbi:AAA family ATPase [Bacillus sp. PsM16]|uniref:ATP-dependent nuclease n=1 Tax=Bacillus sp. PsM16 TaxID=3031172 RepID=UPI00263BC0F7|nr:AAA family ATPase [Bacillus sp. PsM16]MDN4636475.1 AAA family ATPase [Bacillus sp. PsM16]